MMASSFYLLKFIQNNKIKIHTIEEELTDDDIDTYERLSKASSTMSLANTMGLDHKEVIKSLLKHGKIKEEDLKALGSEDILQELNDEDKNDAN